MWVIGVKRGCRRVEVREHGDVVEITGLLDLKTWSAGTRVIVRREHPHPGAALSLFEHATAGATKPSPPTLPWPRAGRSRSSRPAVVLTLGSRTGSGMPRTPGLAGSRPASSTSTPPGRWPRPSRPTSSPGCGCSPTTALRACERKALHYRFLHVPARHIHGARRRRLRFPRTWPWASEIVRAFTAVRALTTLRT